MARGDGGGARGVLPPASRRIHLLPAAAALVAALALLRLEHLLSVICAMLVFGALGDQATAPSSARRLGPSTTCAIWRATSRRGASRACARSASRGSAVEVGQRDAAHPRHTGYSGRSATGCVDPPPPRRCARARRRRRRRRLDRGRRSTTPDQAGAADTSVEREAPGDGSALDFARGDLHATVGDAIARLDLRQLRPHDRHRISARPTRSGSPPLKGGELRKREDGCAA